MSAQDGADRLMRIAVIVVNYGTAALSIKAVQSVLARQHGNRSVCVHVVDNASPGADAAALSRAHKENGWGDAVTLWLETENHGFGRGNNVALDVLRGQETPPDAVFLLNPDAQLENDAIDILARALEANPKAAAAGSQVCRPDGTPVTAAFRFPGPINEVVRITNLSVLWRLARPRLAYLPPEHPAGPVDWVSGSSVMFRFAALQKTGFFDPGFFLYYEEVDLMRRLGRAGWGVLFVPQAQVLHEEGSATGLLKRQEGRQRDPAYMYQSWAHYFERAYGRAGALAIAASMWGAACVNVLHRRLRGHEPSLPSHFFADHWRYVLRPLLWRGAAQR